MKKPIVHYYDIATGKEELRELNDEEFALYETNKKIVEAEQKMAAQKEVIRQSALAKLAALGLTEDEIAAL